ncbi:MAG: phosphoribosylanthranilate isomerase [Nitrosomonas sp.]|uniref:phosphoribosylanthranilate isomerase n=1 Tax=Nitrosomonas sp. TaxID=42353 RepID=UPI001A5E1E9D|nr:phosphoribosylanthranilate isomerase [Nitrosomonas sp.]MBL8499493.1 phosphoribosylanthranilate isomerase [Nitrosomonas sp.]MCG7756855.1 phosphoribosylanthranilate isomerase [Nitrosomonas sp.]UJP00536.1 MAG: phosphoribosylanthranilate isomerase [Nitrosomonas sp.]UJP02331.1 MAG: phosphoribosylanthranilate isomerase [Nitrosomonas sp.]UJP06612.1 MAG: phosphoribosylanthranilate isomerase [Nitrosomonas sp.]
MSVRVKVCGITRSEDAIAAIQNGVDAIGFVFWPHSARYIDPESARRIAEVIPPFICTVGVYVDPDAAWVEETARIAKLNLLQFHGDESPEFCNQFPQPYIKAIRVKPDTDLLQYAQRYGAAKGLLLDTYAADMPGGTGHAFDWQLIPQQLSLPLILSGGLNPDNVARAIKQTQPWAVDVSSGVEASKGIKDEKKIIAFMQGVKQL